jgi:Fe-coproporphyrin III synthase
MNACVITTFRCNAKCQMCDIWQNQTKREEEITPAIVEKLPDGLGRVNVTGGEPMIREDIEDIIGIVYRKAQLVEISTNGFFTERIIRVAERFPRVMIRVSLEGLPKLNDELRGTRDGFDHALRTVLALKKTKVRDFGFSVVIWDRNMDDLLSLYQLCCHLGVEFGNSTMHNSWYFHTSDNRIEDVDLAVRREKEFIRALLTSERRSFRGRMKDYLRAYFNLNILSHLEGRPNLLCGCPAGQDLFFVDPWGNVLPCNGTAEPWIMGNLHHQTFDEIWNSSEAEEIRRRVGACSLECAFIGTARFDMKRRPWRPLAWIAANKLRIAQGKEVSFH